MTSTNSATAPINLRRRIGMAAATRRRLRGWRQHYMVRAPHTSDQDQAIDDDGSAFGPAWARDPAMALRRRRTGARHGFGRRRDAAHRIRPLDHRMAAGHGHAAAARRCAMAERV